MKAIFAFAGMALTASSALLDAQKPMEYQAPRKPEIIYSKVCGYCHGRNVGPIILGRHLPANYISLMARNGRNGMPAFRPTEITNPELDALAAWIAASPTPSKEHGH